MNWVVYTLKCPRTKAVRYVGWTNKSPEARLSAHISEAVGAKAPTYKNRWLLSLLSIGLIPIVEVIESGVGDTWADAERRWIAHYRAMGDRLTNATDGGDGIIGWGTPEQRSEVARKRQAALTPEQRTAAAKKREAAFTPEQRRARALAMTARFTPKELSDRARNNSAVKTPEQRSASAKKQWLALLPEERSARIKRQWAGISPEQRSAYAKRREEGRSEQQRSASAREWQAKVSPEERSARVKQAWVTRKAKLDTNY